MGGDTVTRCDFQAPYADFEEPRGGWTPLACLTVLLFIVGFWVAVFGIGAWLAGEF